MAKPFYIYVYSCSRSLLRHGCHRCSRRRPAVVELDNARAVAGGAGLVRQHLRGTRTHARAREHTRVRARGAPHRVSAIATVRPGRFGTKAALLEADALGRNVWTLVYGETVTTD